MVGYATSWLLAGLVRRTWFVALVTVVVCAVFAAQAVAALVEARYLDSSAHAPAPPIGRVEVAAPASKPDGTELVARNMFCSTCVVESGPANDSASELAFVPDALLIATSIGRDSSATVRVLATDAQGSWGVGDAIPGVGIVARIGFVSIDVTDARGRVGTLSLLTTSGGRSAADAATSAPAAADPFAGRIRKLDDTTFEVERALVRELVSGSMKTGGARIVPITKAGKLDGLRLFGVRAGSVASGLGLTNADVLQAINGTKIESANTLLELYAQLDKLSTVELTGTRRGKPLTLTLRLR